MKTNETPGEPLIAYDPSKCIWTNGKALAKLMSEERKGHALRGFFFDYGMGESMEFKKFCPAMETAAGYMMQAARDTRKQVRVFRNMNGQIACSLATLAQAENETQHAPGCPGWHDHRDCTCAVSNSKPTYANKPTVRVAVAQDKLAALKGTASALADLVALYEALTVKPGSAPAHVNAVQALAALATIEAGGAK